MRDGMTMQEACAHAPYDVETARLIVADDAKYPPSPEAFELPPGWSAIAPFDQARPGPRNPEAAGCAVTTTEEIFMPEDTNDTPLAEMAAETLRGDVRDAMLSWFKATPKPWSQMGEGEQRDFVDTVERVSASILKQACQIIAANERPCMMATLVEYKAKDGLEAKLKLVGTEENAAHLHKAVGREVLVVTSGYEDVAGEAAPAEIDADQRTLAIGEEYDQAA